MRRGGRVFVGDERDGGEEWCRAVVRSRMAGRGVGGESCCGRWRKGGTVRGKAMDPSILVRPSPLSFPLH